MAGIGNAGGKEWAFALATDIETGKKTASFCVREWVESVIGRRLVRSGIGRRPDFADRAAGDNSVGQAEEGVLL